MNNIIILLLTSVIMYITDEQLQKLSTLCAIPLEGKNYDDMKDNLNGIVTLFHKLDELDVSEISLQNSHQKGIHLGDGVVSFDNVQGLLDNVDHEVSGNMIVIKSFRK